MWFEFFVITGKGEGRGGQARKAGLKHSRTSTRWLVSASVHQTHKPSPTPPGGVWTDVQGDSGEEKSCTRGSQTRRSQGSGAGLRVGEHVDVPLVCVCACMCVCLCVFLHFCSDVAYHPQMITQCSDLWCTWLVHLEFHLWKFYSSTLVRPEKRQRLIKPRNKNDSYEFFICKCDWNLIAGGDYFFLCVFKCVLMCWVKYVVFAKFVFLVKPQKLLVDTVPSIHMFIRQKFTTISS